MTEFFISRHPGATAWASARFTAAVVLPEIDVARLAPGDCVYGVLPVDLACAVCERGARFFALVFDRKGATRGAEMSAEELELRGARFEEFFVERR